MHNEVTSNVASDPDDVFVNAPSPNSRVVVQHYPAQGTIKEYWLVYPEAQTPDSPSPQNGTLLSNNKSINYGQFTMPFYFRIDVK